MATIELTNEQVVELVLQLPQEREARIAALLHEIRL